MLSKLSKKKNYYYYYYYYYYLITRGIRANLSTSQLIFGPTKYLTSLVDK